MKVMIYVEGGGDRENLKRQCRKGFQKFFLKAGLKGMMPSVRACGSRQQAYEKYRTALGKASPDQFTILLVDSEDPVAQQHSPWQHLHNRDGWEQPANADSDSAHLMVQVMETWFLADKDELAQYFGADFNKKSLPPNPDIETITKTDVLDGLESATRQCQKGRYNKGSHSFDILANIDPDKVANASPHASKLIDTLKAKAAL